MPIHYAISPSPVGDLLLTDDGQGLTGIRFETESNGLRPEPGWEQGGALVREAAAQLEQYFRGQRKVFDLNLRPHGTAFQLRVWHELEQIPYGQTISYGELARRIDRPSAARAVGAANGKNPLPIVVPCHRVIGKNGDLTGFGGGLEIKARLLSLEGCAPSLGLPF